MKFLVAEQQILLFAAYKTRSRMIRRFGDSIEGLWAFPRQKTSAQASEDQLMLCGLSKRKAEYIREFALKVVEGSTDLDKLKKRAQMRKSVNMLSVFGDLGPGRRITFLSGDWGDQTVCQQTTSQFAPLLANILVMVPA